MITNDELKILYGITTRVKTEDLSNQEFKMVRKLDVIMQFIELQENTQKESAKLQDKILEIEKEGKEDGK